MNNCITCKYAVFDEIWGEYKCTYFQHTVHNPNDIGDCLAYKKKKEKENNGMDY